MKKNILSILFLSLSLCVLAQNTDSLVYITDSVSISAGRFQTARAKIAVGKIDVISNQTIGFLNTQTSADLLQNTGKAFVQKSQGGGGSPVLRGFESNKILLAIDGVRMNNAIFRGGHLQNVIRVDNFSTEQVEIIYGTGSLIYGSDALGGVIHFATKKPDFSLTKPKVNIDFRTGSVNWEKTAHADISLTKKNLASYTSITYSDFGDLRQGKSKNPFYNDTLPYNRSFYVERIEGKDSVFTNDKPHIQRKSAYSQYNIIQKFTLRQNEKIEHDVNFYFSNSSNVPRYDRLTEVGGNGKPRSAEWYYGPETWGMASYRLRIKNNSKLYDEFSLIGAYQYFAESRNSRRLNATNLKSQIEKVNVFSLNLDATKLIKDKFQLQYGLEGNLNTVNSTAHFTNVDTDSTFAADTRYPDGSNTMSSFSAYLTDRTNIGKHFVANLGIRYNYTNLNSTFADTTFFAFPFKNAVQKTNALIWSAGMTYLTDNHLRISANIASAYRTPNLDDMAKVFESVSGNLIIPNSNLKPEYSNTAELSVSKRWQNKVYAEVSAYYTALRNGIALAATQYENQDSVIYDGVKSAVFTNQNLQNAFIYGFYAGLTAEISNNIFFNGSLTYTKGRIVTDSTPTPLDHIPPMFGRLGIGYKNKRFLGEFFSVYQGWKRIEDYRLDAEDNEQYAVAEGAPAWFTLNLKTQTTVNQYFLINAGIENILDTRYRVFASGLSAAGRNIYLGLKLRF